MKNQSLTLILLVIELISVAMGLPAVIKMFSVKRNGSSLSRAVSKDLPFGKRRPTSSEIKRDNLRDHSFLDEPIKSPSGLVLERPKHHILKGMGRSLSQKASSLNSEVDTNMVDGEGSTPEDETTTTKKPVEVAPCHQPTITERRHCVQEKQFGELRASNLKQPNKIPLISATDSIYAHVEWWDDFEADTEIWTGERLIPFKYEFFGSCLPKTTNPEDDFLHLRSSDDVIDFYTILMKEYCHSDIVKVYKRLANLGYLQIAPVGTMKYLIVVKNNSLVTKKKLTMDELSSLVRLYKISAYSEIFTSLLLHPGQAIDPMVRPLGYRAFILINTALHMLDLAATHSEHHYTDLVRLMYRRMLIMGREIYCRYTINPDDKGEKQRRKNDAVATTILMEYLSKCAQKPGDCVGEDAHEGFNDLYNDEELGLHEKYKKKVGDLPKRPSFHHSCTLIFPYLD